ncbi:MAG: hypothetical protein HS122_02795 [Opitutaceae bacterium]|nr:hypothetical protein [Opitutaceae bacterium]
MLSRLHCGSNGQAPHRREKELKGLVSSLTQKLPANTSIAWYARPVSPRIAAHARLRGERGDTAMYPKIRQDR